MLDSAAVNSPLPLRVRSSEEGSTQVSWWTAILTLAVAAICLLSGLRALGLVGPDEPRYMFIARAMLQSGDWITPRLYGQPWFEKPVLYYWAAAAAFRLFGIGEFAARLPSALAALLATAAMAWAALRSYGLDAAWLTLLMLPTTIATLGFARAATPDMLFSALLAAAAVTAAEMLAKKRPGQLARLTFGIFLGAAMLAKGPAAVLLAGGAVCLWALASGQWRATFRLTHPISVAAFVAVAAPWYALCAQRNPEFLRVFLVEHNFSRYLTTEFQHVQPFWFFGPLMLAATIPWTVLLLPLAIAAMARLRANQQWRASPALFFSAWAIFPVLFFSFSESKLPGYVLPAVPPAILLLAAMSAPWLATTSPSKTTARTRVWLALVGCTFPVLSLAAVFWIRGLPMQSTLAASNAPAALLATAIAGGLACTALALTGRLRPAFAAAGVLMAVLLVGVSVTIIPKVDALLSPRTAAQATPPEALDGPNLAILDVNRSWEYGLDFYLDRSLPEWTPAMPAPTWVWTTEQGAGELASRTRTSVIARISAQAWLVRIEK
jgi:4-amino-4-deoxy-L-arabinose transferase-like glycosyltransferase